MLWVDCFIFYHVDELTGELRDNTTRDRRINNANLSSITRYSSYGERLSGWLTRHGTPAPEHDRAQESLTWYMLIKRNKNLINSTTSSYEFFLLFDIRDDQQDPTIHSERSTKLVAFWFHYFAISDLNFQVKLGLDLYVTCPNGSVFFWLGYNVFIYHNLLIKALVRLILFQTYNI